MPLKWIRIGRRWIVVTTFPDSILLQEVYPKMGVNIKYPWEPWMAFLIKLPSN